MKSLPDVAQDILLCGEAELFKRAAHWYYGAASPSKANHALKEKQEMGHYPHFVLAFSQAVVRTHQHNRDYRMEAIR